MSSRASNAGLLLVALLIATAVGCNIVFGYEEGQPGLGTSSGAGATAGAGGSAAAGGTATGTTGTGGGGTGGAELGGSGATGGGPPLPCAGCTSEQKCTVVDESTGTWGCGVAGTRGAWSRCFTDADCAAGLWCDHVTGTCRPICQGAGYCPTGAQCIPAEAAAGGQIPGLTVCTSNCHPMNVDPCHQSYGPTNCVYRVNLAVLDCWQSDNLPAAASCDQSADCAAGFVCASGACRAWCSDFLYPCLVAGTGQFGYCVQLSPQVFHDGMQYGACAP